MNNKTSASYGKLHNEITKKIVALKRGPQVIPLLLLSISCVVYTFNLTAHSNAAIYISNQYIALLVFIITLFSILSIFSYVNTYPKGKRYMPMFIVCLFMVFSQIGLDFLCYNIYMNEIMVLGTPLTADVANAINGTVAHLIFLAISAAAVIFLPAYHKLILKIPVKIEDEESDNIDDGDTEEIESEDDDIEVDDDLE